MGASYPPEVLMDLLYAQLSSQGPVRTNNEDCIAFWQPEDLDAQRSYGALALIADGLGGHGQGEVASQLAVQTALEVFRGLKPDVPPRQALWQLFTAANVAVYDRGMDHRDEARMATTLTASLFRNNEVTIGHVGDCRAYLIAGGPRPANDGRSFLCRAASRLGLMSEADALRSELHTMLTRSIGREPVVQVDYFARARRPRRPPRALFRRAVPVRQRGGDRRDRDSCPAGGGLPGI